MKISKLFHWLYASLCFLPLLVAPIFAIYTRNESAIYTESIQVEQNKVVDFNQLARVEDITSGNYSVSVNENRQTTINVVGGNIWTPASKYQDLDLNVGHKYYVRISDIVSNDSFNYYFYLGSSASSYTSFVYQETNNVSDTQVNLIFSAGAPVNASVSFYLNVFDLTQMFGVGNEPSMVDFNLWYPNYYYDYTSSRVDLLKGYDTITYSNADIGSQFVYTMYTTTEQYLNFDNVFNLYQVYDWIELNVFNGNAPLYFTIAWHYLDYWLLISIFWLCFDVLIYVPQIAHRWLDKAALE